eukprot:CAMPEP_0196575780 /NCGR_PEP_ID=MMETSP1081-20130531/5189_1 /TAXON_ID=36882 /ORGANISM="Pyramimonas amylifera, Strain CCMP720" /LENGTH=104 /DNA_ID=CAMNT_0041894185 /DNA_START=163 /DNA_END=478 /DNA_ORIENTATION=-
MSSDERDGDDVVAQDPKSDADEADDQNEDNEKYNDDVKDDVDEDMKKSDRSASPGKKKTGSLAHVLVPALPPEEAEKGTRQDLQKKNVLDLQKKSAQEAVLDHR